MAKRIKYKPGDAWIVKRNNYRGDYEVIIVADITKTKGGASQLQIVACFTDEHFRLKGFHAASRKSLSNIGLTRYLLWGISELWYEKKCIKRGNVPDQPISLYDDNKQWEQRLNLVVKAGGPRRLLQGLVEKFEQESEAKLKKAILMQRKAQSLKEIAKKIKEKLKS